MFLIKTGKTSVESDKKQQKDKKSNNFSEKPLSKPKNRYIVYSRQKEQEEK
jgi:hypothetical protein